MRKPIHEGPLYDALQLKAREQGWFLEENRVAQVHAGGDGLVPNGIAIVRRERYPFPDREYATVQWYAQPGYVGFEQGHYDLSWEQALVDYYERTRRDQ